METAVFGMPPLLVATPGRARKLRCDNPPLTAYAFDFRTTAHDLGAARSILFYTDGLNEAMNFEDEAFGLERVEKALLAGAGAYDNAQAILKHILWEMRRFTGLQTPGDDLTMVAIKVL